MKDRFCEHEILRAAREGGATVCGVGISNLPLIDFLLERDVKVVARDKQSREQKGEELCRTLEDKGVQLVLGEGYLDDIREAVIFRTPGLRPDHASLTAAVQRGAIMTSEMELFFELTPAHIVAVTGSDGKTTSTTLTYKFLDAELRRRGVGRAYVGGNIGEPLLPRVAEMTENDWAIVELSSFQLMTMRRSPERAAVTNLSPNHLDWHTGMDEYAEAKKNIYRHGARRLTVNSESEPTRLMGLEAECDVVFFTAKKSAYADVVPTEKHGATAIFERSGEVIMSDGKQETVLLNARDILIPGRHNIENYMTAISNTFGVVSADIYAEIARTFPGVEHRLELVRELDGIKYYNSSIDSSPTRTAAALSALTVKPIIICGGYDKHIPFAPLADALCERAEGVVLTGATADKIYEALLACPAFDADKLPVQRVDDFDAAVLAARGMAKPGGVVLLSPACASFDRFKNFMQRGEHFKQIVKNF
ncbi:MAG: UDP-N-acetylmuramoyl-L-alanine--D-glutamate ligase [Clostridia bacterium]|nr:UDP-N-acetylmuramoyl-L-alanine--D-glutamate ligase [Clostridia bacterium]